MQYLKADTQVKVVIGPVVAVANGYVPVTTLALSAADEAEIMTHDAAAVTDISGNTFSAITSADGYYNLTITAGQLATEGMLTILINDDSLCLPVRHDFMVVNANVYDSLFAAAATDYLQVDALQLGGDTQSATDLKDFADAGYDPATNKVQGVVLTDTVTTYTGNTVQTGDSFARLGAPAGASVSVDVAAIKTQTAAIEVDTQDIQTQIGAAGAGLTALATQASVNTIDGIVDNILLDTGELQTDWANGGRLDLIIDAIETDTQDLQSRVPAALVSGRMSSDVVAISGSTTAADRLELSALRIVSGTAQTGTLSTTVMTTNLTEATTDHYKGRVIIWTSGVLVDQATDITAYSGSGGTLTYTAITEAPSNGDTFIII